MFTTRHFPKLLQSSSIFSSNNVVKLSEWHFRKLLPNSSIINSSVNYTSTINRQIFSTIGNNLNTHGRACKYNNNRSGNIGNLKYCFQHRRNSSQWNDPQHHKRNKSVLIYISAVGIFMVGMSYAGVPLYRIFCQSTGLGGQAVVGHDTEKVEGMSSNKERIIRVQFNADTASSMKWNFKPQQTEVRVHPGETSLAFYTAKNPTDKPVVGVSTYNVIPFEAGQYFNKIQCFCFEEQRLNPHEQVDMPVFFYIDPEFAEDPKLEYIDRIILSYTFFEAKDGMDYSQLPGYLNKVAQIKSATAAAAQ
ncbi:cytochrome c oxidase assembly protein ctaG-like [Tubulanus polymorphus]|uniref:cytochrome c oxidase assembly protein ctaG-like n=1 Tax=Tubulanus polymorphus TaxID=672921 RepID=UPI003DA56485